MKMLSIFFVAALMSVVCLAQSPGPVPSASPALAMVMPTPAPTPAPVLSATPIPEVKVAEPAALPQWAQEILVVAEKLPVVGPLVSKILLYAGIFAVLLTSLVAFLTGLLATLSGVFNFAGLAKASAALVDFKNGKIMYWITYFSNFNAQKPPSA